MALLEGSCSSTYSMRISAGRLKFDQAARWSALPAIVYAIDNTMVPYIASFIDPAIISALFNLKIVASALMMWLVLGHTLQSNQVMAVVLIALGSAMTQDTSAISEAAAYDSSNMAFGSALVVITCCCSAVAGVVSQQLLKGGARDTSIHCANIQLYSWGIIVAGSLAVSKQCLFNNPVQPLSIFEGFNRWALLAAVGQAASGNREQCSIATDMRSCSERTYDSTYPEALQRGGQMYCCFCLHAHNLYMFHMVLWEAVDHTICCCCCDDRIRCLIVQHANSN